MTRKSLIVAVVLAVMFCAGFLSARAANTQSAAQAQPSEYFGFVVAP